MTFMVESYLCATIYVHATKSIFLNDFFIKISLQEYNNLYVLKSKGANKF
jgi:hypothetical protein